MDQRYWNPLAIAENEIQRTYGDEVSAWNKAKTLLKFGRNSDLGTSFETVWTYGGDETYATTNAIDTVSSSNAGDTAVMRIEYHTVSGTGADSVFTFGIQDVTLNGQNKVLLATPCARVSRAIVLSGSLAGDFYVYEDDTLTAGVPNTASKVHMQVVGSLGFTQSLKAATTMSSTDYGIITGGFVSIDKKTAANADFQLEIKVPGGVFRPVARTSLSSTAQTAIQINLLPYVILPKNSDIRVRSIASVTGAEVDAAFQMYIAQVRG